MERRESKSFDMATIMKRSIISGVAISALLVAAPLSTAFAANGWLKAPLTAGGAAGAEAYDWTGWYAGVSIGLGFGQSKQSGATAALTPTFDVDGDVFGFTTGYKWQLGRVVFGVDSDISFSTVQGTSGFTSAAPGFIAETSQKWLSTARARLGLARDRWMVYLTGGAAAADIGIMATEPGAGIASQDQVRWGWTTGLGVEAVGLGGPHLYGFSLKVEYLFVDFQNAAYFNPAPTGFFNRAGGVPLSENLFRIGLDHKIEF